LAKPGLSGFSSNSSEQTAQTRIGNAILSNMILTANILGEYATAPLGY
jgi:hypothetical protein